MAGSDPFDVAGVQWRPVSPKLATVRRIVLAVWCLVAALPPLVVGVWLGRWWVGALAALPLAGLIWGSWLIGRQVSAWAYAERDEDLLVRAGRIWRRMVVVPYGRLQYVDVDEGPIARMFGLASVQLHTASAGTDSQIPGLEAAEAARLRDRLTERGQAQLAGL